MVTPMIKFLRNVLKIMDVHLDSILLHSDSADLSALKEASTLILLATSEDALSDL